MINQEKNVRVRFGPSPTGFLHIGGARTVLFNWLFAKSHNGVFILRIEDTNKERSKKEYEEDIINSLKWLGLDWDEGPDIGGNYGPYRQSEKINIYEKYLEQLLNQEKAYYCFCSKEELEIDRQALLSQGLAPKYSGRCRNLSADEVEKKMKIGDKPVIRLKIPDRKIEFQDIIRGKIQFDAGLMGDIIIAKGLNEPLYNFAVAIDDYEMNISHVIRGEEHLSNTPKQILIREVLNLKHPIYAHLPLILAPDRSKLSKRRMDASVVDYKNQGYLSEAIINFIALLGWHPEGEKEILSKEELIKQFNLKKVQKAGAIFDVQKLDWLNSQYIKTINPIRLIEEMENFVPKDWFAKKELLAKAINAEKERIKKLADFKELADFFFELPDYEPLLLKWKNMENNQISNNLKAVKLKLENISENDFNKDNEEKIIMPLAKERGIGDVLWPLRAALSGKQASPGPFEIINVIGKNESLKRIEIALNKLNG
ncbi:MAG: glutamate--tRNA ligase [Patescibacteria group bacterium]